MVPYVSIYNKCMSNNNVDWQANRQRRVQERPSSKQARHGLQGFIEVWGKRVTWPHVTKDRTDVLHCLHCAPSPHRCRLIVSRYWSESYAKACCGDLSVACHPPLRRQLSTSQPLSWHEKPRPPDRPTPQGSSLGAGYRTPAAHRSHSTLSVQAHHTCPPTRF